MVELIGKISRGTRMDQIYIPKERLPGFDAGTFVLIKPVLEKEKANPFYYNVPNLEPIKTVIIGEILDYFKHFENVVITGSFLEKGFDFEDIDVILMADKKIGESNAERHFKSSLGINVHITALDHRTLLKGLKTDPLFQMMLSRFVSKKRVIFKFKNEVNYKLLDLHLLKSKALIGNFDFLVGKEKYKMARNLFAIKIFMENKKISAESINNDINGYFGKNAVENIKENLLDKGFIDKYKKLYNETFKKIMAGIKDGSK